MSEQNQPSSFSLKEQAAIELRIPNSGTQWLDAMIAHSRRQEMSAELFRQYCESKLTDANVAIVKKNGLEAWLRTNGTDLSEALVMCEAMAKTTRPVKPAAPPAAAPAPASAPAPTLALNG
jgi:hypothetical protein